jgi:thioredoxin reductase (NADPH)
MKHRLAVIGSGPAGLTAALYAARAGLAPITFEGSQAGGQLMLTTDVENYPGFPNGILGPELISLLRRQAEQFGAELQTVDITGVDFSSRPFRLSADQDKHQADAVIIATGSSARWLGIPGEDRLRGFGVSSCATCDGFFFKGQDLIVVGGGDSAMEEALFLTKFASKVTIVHRRDELRASQIMAQRALAHPQIHVRWNTVVEDILGDKAVEAVRLRDVQTDETERLPIAGVFVAIGHTPNTGIFAGQLELDHKGYLKTYGNSSTSVAGVFGAGDVVDHTYRQAITAAGMGCQAAIDAGHWLDETE